MRGKEKRGEKIVRRAALFIRQSSPPGSDTWPALYSEPARLDEIEFKYECERGGPRNARELSGMVYQVFSTSCRWDRRGWGGGVVVERWNCVSWIRPQEIVDFYGLSARSRFSNLALIFHADAANV